jgi:hypothetical protein
METQPLPAAGRARPYAHHVCVKDRFAPLAEHRTAGGFDAATGALQLP